MELLRELNERANKNQEKEKTLCISSALSQLAIDIEKDTRQYLKRVIGTLPDFDLHDETHSEKVIDNIEQLLGEKVKSLSSHELFLLHLSGFMHDCAMSPPDWEIRVLEMTEGIKDFSEMPGQIHLFHDLKPPLLFTEALKIINENKIQLYISFDETRKCFLSPASEVEFQHDLAERLINYQVFRNGYAKQLEELKRNADKSGFSKLSNSIRTDFIRSTHHVRGAQYIRNMSNLFSSRLGGTWGRALANDLALICQAHGEGTYFLEKLNQTAAYLGADTTNLQFIATLLRLSDIIHFSFDRAPEALMTAKQFESLVSFRHWAVKNQGVNYTISSGTPRTISFRAYCNDPESYYMIQDYMDLIDNELMVYFKFLNYWTTILGQRYSLLLHDKVDRTNVRWDNNVFTPVHGLRFTLNQKRIIELLMGVGLYKNKYACLRELYQNSLDACRCMLSVRAQDKVVAKGMIEFGIERNSVEGAEKTFLYCCDNGIGMTKEIIEKYLLKIGNSYYQSPDFERQRIAWNSSFTPTSQFGIGILSCFMLGSRIEITSKFLTTNGSGEPPLCCVIDGPHEHLYYKKTDPIDIERLGASGTLVRIQLKPEIASELRDTPLEKPFLLMHGQNIIYHDEANKKLFRNWNHHLFHIMSDFVGIPANNISVAIRQSNGNYIHLKNWAIPFDYQKLDLVESDIQWLEKAKRRYSEEPAYNYLDFYNFIVPNEIRVEHNGLEFWTSIPFPKPDFPLDCVEALAMISSLRGDNRGTILIDGISVESNVSLENYYFYSLSHIGVLNFTGPSRPQLSVDRNSITSWPNNLEDNTKEILWQIFADIIRLFNGHIDKFKLTDNSPEIDVFWKYLFKYFTFCTGELVDFLAKQEKANIPIQEFVQIVGKALSLREFINSSNINIPCFTFASLTIKTQTLLLGKLVNAQTVNVNGQACEVINNTFSSVTPFYGRPFDREWTRIFISTDDWKGLYGEFDLVSSMWPLIPPHLYRRLLSTKNVERRNLGTRSIELRCYSNGITAIIEQESVLVHQRLGMFKIERHFGRHSSDINRVYRFEKLLSDFWLFEVNGWENNKKTGKRYILLAYIAPCKLTESEKQSLEERKHEDPEYVKGVREGWSILFLGDKDTNTIILPGIHKRSDIVARIPNSFWKREDGRYRFLDETPLNNLRNVVPDNKPNKAVQQKARKQISASEKRKKEKEIKEN